MSWQTPAVRDFGKAVLFLTSWSRNTDSPADPNSSTIPAPVSDDKTRNPMLRFLEVRYRVSPSFQVLPFGNSLVGVCMFLRVPRCTFPPLILYSLLLAPCLRAQYTSLPPGEDHPILGFKLQKE